MISIIIPTYNEAAGISRIVRHIRECPQAESLEIIVVDSPESSDSIENVVVSHEIKLLKAEIAGRNFQMNFGAESATGSVLYFVHADTLVHRSFVADIQHALGQGYDMGCYRFKFDTYPNVLMYINSFFTRFPMIWCRGGDQTLFVRREAFWQLGGFCPQHVIMEDYDILIRSKPQFRFKIIPKSVIVSARKYRKNSYWGITKANYLVMNRWLRHVASPHELRQLYKMLLIND